MECARGQISLQKWKFVVQNQDGGIIIMMEDYLNYFGFRKEPFGTDVAVTDLFETSEILAAKERFEYTINLGGVGLLTGDVGSGKTTTLRYGISGLHPSEYRVIYLTSTSGSILEMYRLLLSELGIDSSSSSRAVMIRQIKREIEELVRDKKLNVVLIIDEASLLRLDVFIELHTLAQFQKDSKAWLPIILAGQANLIDKLSYRSSSPLASRIIARSHLEGVSLEVMEAYLTHRLAKAGITTHLFEPPALVAIYQGSGGLFRKANHLARGALIGTFKQKMVMVTADHVRIASSEIF